MARARTHARSTVQPADDDECEERETPLVGITPATVRLGAISFHRRPQPLIYRQHRELLIRVPCHHNSCSQPAILAISFNRLPTFVPASSPPPQSLHNSGFFRVQVSCSTVLHHHRRPRNVIVRPFGTVPTGLRRVHIASHHQRTRSDERWTVEQGT